MSWSRATAAGAAIVVVAVLLLAYVPNWVLTKLSYSRNVKVAICVIVSNVALVLILLALRRLQARRLI